MNYILNESSISFVVNSKLFSISRSDSKFHQAIGIVYDPLFSEELKLRNLQNLVDDKFHVSSLLNLCPAILSKSDIYYNNLRYSTIRHFLYYAIENSFATADIESFVNSISVVQYSSNLLEWIKNNKSLISKDGNLYLYKGLRENFKDCYSEKITNFVGKTNEMPEEEITKCQGGPGFYFGTFERAKNMSRGNMVLCRVQLSDIVWIGDSELKVKKYKVVKEEYLNLPVGVYDFPEVDWVEPVQPEAKKAFKAIRMARRLGIHRRRT